jgi:MFS family permease
MIQTLIHRLLQRRHFWRYATFGEVAELYASRTLRLFALRIVTTFTSVYLLLEGYNLVFLAFFWAAFYLVKVVFAYPSARIIAYFGPKHATLYSNIISAIGMVFLPFTTDYGLYALVPWLILQSLSGTLNDLSYLVDFSKVKSIDHAGKEIGYMNIFEKVAGGLSPVIGGFLAFWIGPEIVMALSAILFLLSAVPLFKTGEPTRLHQKLEFRGFPWRTTWRSLVAETAIGFDIFTTGSAWTLFMAIVIFAGNGDEMFAKIGVLTSIALFAALGSSYAFGKLIDRRRGRELLIISSVVNSLVHVFRVFVTTPAGVAATNVINESTTTGYSMAFTRGMFDTADNTGRRIVYLFFIEIVINFGAALGALVLGGLAMILHDDAMSIRATFIIAAVVVLLIATPRFMLYRK